MITVSVLMITYGHEKYIEEAINGVLIQQCNFDVELIIADDNSPDNTENVVKKSIEKNPYEHCIKYTKHSENKGMITNGLWALQQSEGKYIAVCEGDDYWTDPQKLQKQVDFLEANEDFGLVFTDLDFYYQETDAFKTDVFKNKTMPLYFSFEEHLVNAGYLGPCTWLCRKELIPILKIEYVDGTFPWLLHIMANSKVKYLKDNTAVYRVLKESASKSRSFNKKFKFSKGVFEIQKEFLNKNQQSNEIIYKIFSKAYLSIFPLAMILGKDSFIKESKLFWSKNRNSFKEKLFYQLSFLKISKHIFRILYRCKVKLND